MRKLVKRILIHLGESDTGKAVIDLAVLLRTRLLIQAASGGGKSWLIRRLVEQAFGKVQIFIIDPEGEFASLREKFPFVLVGQGGEAAIDVRSAALTAHTFLEHRVSAIFDIFEMKPSQRAAWVRAFLEAMVDAPKKLWHPVIVVVDEAHTFCPEKGAGESEASEAMISLGTRGRKRGFCVVPATQRLAKLRKDFAAECQNVMIGKTTLADDRDRSANEMGVEKKRDIRDEFSNALRRLKPGEFFGTGPAIADDRILIRVGDVQTSHPESGKYKKPPAPPPPTSKIKKLLPVLADLPQAAEEKAKTEAELKKEVRSLKAQLRVRPTEVDRVEVPVVDKAAIKKMRRELHHQYQDILNKYGRRFKEIYDQVTAIRISASNVKKIKLPKLPKLDVVTVEPTKPVADPKGATTVVTMKSRSIGVSTMPADKIDPKYYGGQSEIKLKPGARRMLEAMAQFHPNAISDGQISAMSGMKRSSGSFSTYMSNLRMAGFFKSVDGKKKVTEKGLAWLGDAIPDAPTTTEEVLAIWKPKLKPGACRMLDAILAHKGELVSHEEITGVSGIDRSSGSYSTYLSNLVTANLVIRAGRDGAKANKENLFL